jgi:hypothetical protein
MRWILGGITIGWLVSVVRAAQIKELPVIVRSDDEVMLKALHLVRLDQMVTIETGACTGG